MRQNMFVLRSPAEKKHIQRILFSSDLFKDNKLVTDSFVRNLFS